MSRGGNGQRTGQPVRAVPGGDQWRATRLRRPGADRERERAMSDGVARITPVILSGGTGSRLWPLSRESYPKQLLPLFGDHTLLQQTALRVTDSDLFDPLLVIAGDEHRFVVAEQLRALGLRQARLILEPESRGTAPAAAVAALHLAHADPDDLLLLCPADHLIRDDLAFKTQIARAIPAARSGHMVLFGITPTQPSTAYGYIRRGPALDSTNGFVVARFVEKPDVGAAQTYLAGQDCFWNSGLVLATARTLIEEFDRHAPAVLAASDAALAELTTDLDFLRLDRTQFLAAPAISLDRAVIERTERAIVVPALFDWADVGTWSAIAAIEAEDDSGNVAIGDAEISASRGCYVRSEGPLVAALGLDNMIVVATPDAVLVAAKEYDEEVGKIVARLKARNHSAGWQNPKVHRPWGYFQPIHAGERFQVKRITVKPGGKLSLQKHYHRAEHWVVVNGTALVTRGDEETLLRENESIFIPLGTVHRLENPGKVPLDLIEVQSGPYLGEDDIVRIEDIYARI